VQTCPIWPPVLPQNLTSTLPFPLQVLSVNLPCGDCLYSMCQISCPFSFALVVTKNPSMSEVRFNNTYHDFVLRSGVLNQPHAKPQTLEDHLLSAVHDCLFNKISATLNVWRPFPPSANSSHLRLVVSFRPTFPPKSYMHSSSLAFVLRAPPISSSLTW
jgi:hypothetical protein